MEKDKENITYEDLFKKALAFASQDPEEFLIYQGTIDSVAESSGVVYEARLKISNLGPPNPERAKLRFVDCYRVTDGIIKTEEAQKGLYDMNKEPLIRTDCEVGDLVEVIGWRKDMREANQSELVWMLNLPVRAYFNHTSGSVHCSGEFLRKAGLQSRKKPHNYTL